jgi:hypothetical protein
MLHHRYWSVRRHQGETLIGGCIARDGEGRACGAPGVLLDGQRGGMVCAAHVPHTPLLRFSIRRAMSYPDAFLAAALAELTDEALAAALGCAPSVVWQLRLARQPRTGEWQADVARLAAAVGCPPRRLARLLRRLGPIPT